MDTTARIKKMDKLRTAQDGPRLYIKHHDSGKMDFTAKNRFLFQAIIRTALNQECDTLVICCGLLSKDARTYAGAAAQIGTDCVLLLIAVM